MVASVRFTDDPSYVLREAGPFLEGDPVRHNLILTLLNTRISHPEPGRYWIVDIDGVPAGVAFQSPLDFFATITPMASEAVEALADAIVEQGVSLPGVNGVATTTARFAGHWTERTKSAAHPAEGQRLYELEELILARPTTGSIRAANQADRALLIEWSDAFRDETGAGVGETAPTVDRRIGLGQFWLWDDTELVSLTGVTDPLAGVVRVGPVYTPPHRRGRGFASALVASVSMSARAQGDRVILYTDLANPVSNSVYRAIGFRAVDEVLRYEFH